MNCGNRQKGSRRYDYGSDNITGSTGLVYLCTSPVNNAQNVQVMSLKFNPLPDVLRACEPIQMPAPHLHKNHEVFEGNNNVFYQLLRCRTVRLRRVNTRLGRN